MNRTIIIAEAGVNHNGSLIMAKQLIDVAAEAGADYVKFQTFVAEKSISPDARKAEYQKASTGNSESQLEMVKKLELSREDHIQLVEHCKRKGIKFLSTAFDDESVDLLNEINIDFFKVPSGEITNLPLLRKIAETGADIVMSSGMSTMSELVDAIQVFLDFGYHKEQITVLHCNTEYPTPICDVNLRAMNTIGKELNVKVGYSDHTLGIEIPIAAVALGASVIEKHFTLDNSLDGPDHQASLNPEELLSMVKGIRVIEEALGSDKKEVSASEMDNKLIARKSIHFVRNMKSGEQIAKDDLIMLRPGDGVSPMEIDKVLGKELITDVTEHSKFNWDDIEN